ncbi:uncharacterized protein BDZ99DRAFT_497186 [Mytilinidion resinicola]|uniref:Uncharacterized protein n=1 Tax=Mytilinidion resinicola TaxID=574789 RepID=A0A6A6YU25_9PEZI|nr:uncharacterized protein BDZ99DRAFT_497186 [Mytilinidion resinicola]KAF2811417.1 hypothetical protein BDZ99DRAFT_497186 [Mytilinidion resinicola]
MNLSLASPPPSQWDALLRRLDPTSADLIATAFYHMLNESEATPPISLLAFTLLFAHTFALARAQPPPQLQLRHASRAPPPLPVATPFSAPHNRVLVLRNSVRSRATVVVSPASDASSAYPEIGPEAYCGFPAINWGAVRVYELPDAGEIGVPEDDGARRERQGDGIRRERVGDELAARGVQGRRGRENSDTTLPTSVAGGSADVSPASSRSSVYPEIERGEYCGFEAQDDASREEEGDEAAADGVEVWHDSRAEDDRGGDAERDGESPALGARLRALCMDGGGQKKEAMRTVALGGGKGGRAGIDGALVEVSADENEVLWSPCERKMAKWMDGDGSSCRSPTVGRLGARGVRKPLAEIY